ncbi:unnamed protein product [Dovyalis caffra]|uniref:Uncharacterized protein n=1 Tax=Dovyalis caffra TaxID=77055 RepID=A0AAV1SEX7_9ROSI|nr:unnamed protein product [Dovyalis caffra]
MGLDVSTFKDLGQPNGLIQSIWALGYTPTHKCSSRPLEKNTSNPASISSRGEMEENVLSVERKIRNQPRLLP